jgi:heptosyltransferase-2
LGDFVLTTPIFRALKAKYPDAKLHLLASKSVMQLAIGCHEIDTFITIPKGFTCWCSFLEIPLSTTLRIAWFARRFLRPLQPELVILPRVDADCYGSIWITAFSGASRRIAFSESSTQWKASYNRGSDKVFTDVIRAIPGSHEVESLRTLANIMELDISSWKTYLWWSGRDLELVDELINGIKGNPILVFAPGAADERRRWPAPYFGEAGRRLELLGYRIIIVGGPSDREIGEEISSYLTNGMHLNFAGKLSLQETAAVMSRCAVFIGNDSGPMHMASAVQVPCVEVSSFPKNGEISHVNSPSRFGPWAVPSIVIQPDSSLAPCTGYCMDSHAHCIRQITPDQVVNAVCALVEITDGN